MTPSQEGCTEGGSLYTNRVSPATVGDYQDIDQWLVEMGCDVDTTPYDEEYPLHLAAGAGCSDFVELLLDHECEANHVVSTHGTPLSAAAQGHALPEDVTTLKKLYGADLHAKKPDGRTAMHWAAIKGKPEVVDYLLQQNCDAHAADKDGVRPLHLAAREGHAEVVRLLLARGCSLDVATNFEEREQKWWPSEDTLEECGMTALHFAASKGRLAVAELLLHRGCDASPADAKGRTALHHAGRRGDAAMGALLLRHGCRVDARDAGGRTALHLAASDETLAFAAVLLDHGADADAATTYGWTALHCAARGTYSGALKTVQMLLARGCNVNAKTARGWTALHVAASYGPGEEYSTNGMLVKVWKKIYCPVTQKVTSNPLSHKLGGAEQHVAAAALLMDRGCDVEAKDADGRTALDVAVAKRTHCILGLFLERGSGLTAKERKAVQDALRARDSSSEEEDSSSEEESDGDEA